MSYQHLGEGDRETVVIATAPSAWAPAIINGDYSGLSDKECATVEAFLDRIDGDPVACTDAGFKWKHDAWKECPLGADCQEYTFIRR